MATIVVTNLSASPVYLKDLYVTLGASGQKLTSVGPTDTCTVTRPENELNRMKGLMDLVYAGTVSVAVTPETSEVGSDLLVPPQSVTGNDVSPVAAATLFGTAPITVRIPITAGAASPSDTAVVAVGALPYKFRVLDAYIRVTTASGANNLTVQTRASGAGTAVITALSTAAQGIVRETGAAVSASVVVTPGASDGLYVRNSASAAWAGDIILVIRKES